MPSISTMYSALFWETLFSGKQNNLNRIISCIRTEAPLFEEALLLCRKSDRHMPDTEPDLQEDKNTVDNCKPKCYIDNARATIVNCPWRNKHVK